LKLKELIELIGEKKLKKSLGQNLLINDRVAEEMVEYLEGNDEEVLEIGSGTGIVTQKLIEKGLKPVCVEIDRDFCRVLKERFNDRIYLFCMDFFKFPPDNFEGRLITGSLPYRGAKKMIAHILLNFFHFKRGTFLLQREVADILMAEPKTRDYSPITVIARIRGRVRKIRDVSPASFYPEPGVVSSLVLFEMKEPPPPSEFYTLLRLAFSGRRKNLKNNLKPVTKGLPEWFPSKKRAEEICPEEFLEIFYRLKDEGFLSAISKT